jgi:hypothetical protein
MDPLQDAMFLRYEKHNRWIVEDYQSLVLAHLTTKGAWGLAESFYKELPKPRLRCPCDQVPVETLSVRV